MLGKVKLIRRAIMLKIISISIGNGFGSSATNGAKIVKKRAQKLQIPMLVALLRCGNIAGSGDAIVAKHKV